MSEPITEQTGQRILACMERIELMLARRLPRSAPKRTIGTNAVPMAEIVAAWCEVCPLLDRPTQLTNDRRMLMRNFWRKFDKVEGGNMEGVRGVFEMVAESDFLCGRIRGATWRADMWWVIDPNHLAHILEGRYRNEVRNPNARR